MLLVLRGQDARITVPFVKRPGNHHSGIAPHGRRHGLPGQDVGHDKRHNAPCLLLLGSEVGQPELQEAGRIVEEGCSGREDLDVAGPAQPLVALRAVGRYVEEVAPHAPYDVLVQPVDERVGALKPAGALHVGVAEPPRWMSSDEARPASPRPPHSESRGR